MQAGKGCYRAVGLNELVGIIRNETILVTQMALFVSLYH